MKCYTDLEGKIEAKEGDRVALVIQDGTILKQPNFLNRPVMASEGGIEFKQEEFMEEHK